VAANSRFFPLRNGATARASAANQTGQITERELLSTIAAGSHSAMAEFYVLHFARLRNFFVHVTRRIDLVEELINDTMFDVWRKSATIGWDASVPDWIMSLAYLHGQVRLARAELAPQQGPSSALYTKHDGALATTPQKPGNLQDLLLALPFEERAVLHLVYSGFHSRQSIAGIMNTSCGRVDVLLAQARRRLSCLKEEHERRPPHSPGP
jgi:DNA-directed RNA polymerase specialized sigma24 family protein